MRSRITNFSLPARLWASAAIIVSSLTLIAGCGGSMASSSTDWSLTSVTPYGTPDVTITPTSGTVEGSFTVKTSTSVTAVNSPIFVEAIFAAEVQDVNAAQITAASPAAVGTFSVQWSEVLAPGETTPRATFNSPNGTTFTGATAVTPNVLLSGDSGNFVTVSSTGPLNLKLHVTLQTADGSTKSKDFYTTLYITAATSAS